MDATAMRAGRVARSLMLDAAAVDAIGALANQEIGVLLLKGPAVAAWLYDGGSERTYRDIDLIVDPTRYDDAVTVLIGLGYRPHALGRAGTDARPRALSLHRDGAVLDVHRRLVGVDVSEFDAWAILATSTERMTLNGTAISVLSPPARALHLGLHAAQRGVRDEQPIEDLRRGLARLDDDVWLEAAQLAYALDAAPAFGAGLRLISDGQRMALRLGLPSEASAETQLRAGAAPDAVIFIERLHRATWSRRYQFIKRTLFPPADWLLETSGSNNTSSRKGVARLRARRALSVAARALPAYRDWRRRRGAAEAPGGHCRLSSRSAPLRATFKRSTKRCSANE